MTVTLPLRVNLGANPLGPRPTEAVGGTLRLWPGASRLTLTLPRGLVWAGTFVELDLEPELDTPRLMLPRGSILPAAAAPSNAAAPPPAPLRSAAGVVRCGAAAGTGADGPR